MNTEFILPPFADHLSVAPSLREFQHFLRDSPEAELNLARAALLIAKSEYPNLSVDRYMARFEELAERVWSDLFKRGEPHNMVISMNRILFEEEGYVGNTHDYYDPRNSFLNEVMERREGIPISLCIIYLELGRRLGLPLEGVSFPEHFLVKMAVDKERVIVLDPFSGGLPVSEDTLRQRLEHAWGGLGRVSRQQLSQFLRTAQPREILLRLLRNLRSVYIYHEQWAKLLSIITQILLLRPDLAEEWRDRGALYQHLECPRAALADFRHYLQLQPEAEEADNVREQIMELEEAVRHLH